MKLIPILIFLFAVVSGRSYPLFKQCNGSWSTDIIGSGPDTICQVGCLLSSVSEALNSYGRTVNGQVANPRTVNNWLNQNGGYYGELFIWASISPLGFNFQGKFTAEQVPAQFDSGRVIILNVRNGGHWVLMTGYQGSTFYVNDSGFSNTSYNQSDVVEAGVYTVNSGFLQKAYDFLNNFKN